MWTGARTPGDTGTQGRRRASSTRRRPPPTLVLPAASISLWWQRAVSTFEVCDGGSLPPPGVCSKPCRGLLPRGPLADACGASYSPCLNKRTHSSVPRGPAVGDLPAEPVVPAPSRLPWPRLGPPPTHPLVTHSRARADAGVPPWGCFMEARASGPHPGQVPPSHPSSPGSATSGPRRTTPVQPVAPRQTPSSIKCRNPILDTVS